MILDKDISKIIYYVPDGNYNGSSWVETIFEHNVTKKELELLKGFNPVGKISSRETYLKDENEDRSMADLYRLYVLRGDNLKAEQFLNRINDIRYKYLLSSFWKYLLSAFSFAEITCLFKRYHVSKFCILKF